MTQRSLPLLERSSILKKQFRSLLSLVLAVSLSAIPGYSSEGGSSLISWQKWTPDLFTRARSENKLVILDLEAVWCHWCHVMDQTTYSDAGIAKILGDKYIAV